MQCQFSLEALLSSGQQGRVGEAKKAEKNYLVSQGLGDKILREGEDLQQTGLVSTLKTLEPAGDGRGKSQTQNILRVQLLGRRRQRPVRPIKSLERPYLGNGKPEVD